MLGTWVVALVLSQAGTVKPLGSVQAQPLGKLKGVIVAPEAPVTFELDGSGTFVLELRGQGKKADKVSVTFVRDERFTATGAVTLAPDKKPMGPFAVGAVVGLRVAPGAHKVVVSVDKRVAVIASRPASEPKNVTFLSETESGGATQVAAAPAAATVTTAAAPAPATPAKGTDTEELAAIMASSAAAASTVATGSVDPSRRGAAMRVAVYDFELSAIEVNIGQVVTDSTLAEVRKLQSIAAIGMDEIKAMLSHEVNKQYMGCEENESCLAEIAGALGVDELVTGKLAKVDDGVSILVRRIDQRRAKVVGVFNQRLKASSGEEFLAAIGPAIEQLFPEYQLREGTSRGVPKEMALRLSPPPLPRWSFFTVAGAAVAAAAIGGVFGLRANDAEAAYQDLAASKTTIEGRQLVGHGDDAKKNASYANYSFIGAGVMAVSAGVMALFTDWYGYGEEQPAAR